VHGGSDEAVFRTISKGVPGTTMPAFAFSGIQICSLSLTSAHSQSRTAQTKSRVTLKPAPRFFARTVPVAMWLRKRRRVERPRPHNVGARRSHAELRESIADPDAQVASEYWSVAATTSNGRKVRGIRLNEDTFSFQLREENGRLLSLLKRDLKDVELNRRSPMPSFKDKLSEAQMDDVIAWLVSLRRNQ
jgi:putative heme-binding domain-containing protein